MLQQLTDSPADAMTWLSAFLVRTDKPRSPHSASAATPHSSSPPRPAAVASSETMAAVTGFAPPNSSFC